MSGKGLNGTVTHLVQVVHTMWYRIKSCQKLDKVVANEGTNRGDAATSPWIQVSLDPLLEI